MTPSESAPTPPGSTGSGKRPHAGDLPETLGPRTEELTRSLGRTGGANPAPTEPLEGVWGRFRLMEKVGQGGFGEVYRAWDLQLNREVALKLLQGGATEEDYQLILREARAAARVKHPNVVPVFGVERVDGRVGFWSEFVRGKHLGRLVDEQGPYSAAEAAYVGMEVCRATSAVHSAGMLHRDIKASNVMREAGGRILLMDFGLTQEVSPDGDPLGGTLLYMAPELIAGEPASAQSDVYAIGILLFYLTSGEYPSDAKLGSPQETPRRRLIDVRPDLPESFVRIVENATAQDPARRYHSAGEMMAALSDFATTSPLPAALPGPPPRPKSTSLLGLGNWPLLGLIVLLLGCAYWLYRVGGFANLTPAIPPAVNEEYTKGQDLLARYDKPGNVDQAISLYQKLTTDNAASALGFAGLADSYIAQFDATKKLGVLEQAQTAATRAVALDAQQPRSHLTLAKCYIRSSRNDLAAQELKIALDLDPRNAATHAELGLLYQRQGRKPDVVVPSLQTAIDLAPNDWRWPNRLGLYYLNSGKLNEAAQQFAKVTELTPSNRFGYVNAGLAHRRLGNFDEAMRQYRKALDIDPHYSQALINIGSVLTWQGKYPEAVEMFKRATDENPDDSLVWASLASAYFWSPGGHQAAQNAYRKAIELAEKRHKEDPANAELLANLGSDYAAIGDRAHSLPLIRQALALSPDEPVLLSRAAMAYELLGERAEAINLLIRALQRGYSYEFVERNPELAALRRDPKFIAKLPKSR